MSAHEIAAPAARLMHHEVHYSLFIDGVFRGKGFGVALGESAEAAEAAFRSEYADDEKFEYRVFKVVAPSWIIGRL